MIKFKDFLKEEVKTHYSYLPPEPGKSDIPDGHIRLYHRTNSSNMKSIAKHGLSIDHAKGYEGPKAIYADPKGFYGKPGDLNDHEIDVEFHVPKDKFHGTIVSMDHVPTKNIVAIHQNWHSTARLIDSEPKLKKEILDGDHDDAVNFGDQYKYSIKHIKSKYGKKND